MSYPQHTPRYPHEKRAAQRPRSRQAKINSGEGLAALLAVVIIVLQCAGMLGFLYLATLVVRAAW